MYRIYTCACNNNGKRPWIWKEEYMGLFGGRDDKEMLSLYYNLKIRETTLKKSNHDPKDEVGSINLRMCSHRSLRCEPLAEFSHVRASRCPLAEVTA